MGQYQRSMFGVSQHESGYTSPAENSATLKQKGEVNLKQLWSDLDL